MDDEQGCHFAHDISMTKIRMGKLGINVQVQCIHAVITKFKFKGIKGTHCQVIKDFHSNNFSLCISFNSQFMYKYDENENDLKMKTSGQTIEKKATCANQTKPSKTKHNLSKQR